MKNCPIGVFDSGLGGLTAVKELVKILPDEDIIYFGDTSRVPYGTRSRDTIIRYAKQDLRFLDTFGIKAALVACGTVSAVALPTVADKYPFPVIGVIDATVLAALKATKNNRIGIIGTPATIRSDAYAKKIKELCPECETLSTPCPLFVPLVENGHVDPCDPLAKAAVELYISKIKDFRADTVILGCTHYPILAKAIGKYVGQQTVLINSGREAARTVKQYLSDSGLLADKGRGRQRYFVSDSTEDFETYGGIFMTINGEVKKIDIEKY